MGRETRFYAPVANFGLAYEQIRAALVDLKFEETVYENENVFKKGNGWVSGPNFIKVTPTPAGIQVEGWLKFALLPGVFLGEVDLKSFVGAAAKSGIKNGLARIAAILVSQGSYQIMNYGVAPQIPYQAPNAQPAYNPYQQMPPAPAYPQYQAPQPAPVYNQPQAPVAYTPPVQTAPDAVPVQAVPVPRVEENRDTPVSIPVLPFEDKTNIG